MDLFKKLKGMESVEKVSNILPGVEERPLNFFFFVCPKLKGNGYSVNRNKTGFTTRYVEGQRESTFEKIERVKRFLEKFRSEHENAKISLTCVCVLAGGEALTLFPIPIEAPSTMPSEIKGIPVMSNYKLVKDNLLKFWELYQTKPWERIPDKTREEEYAYIQNLIEYTHAPDNLVRDFAERIWAEYALDGILAKEGKFGKNPVLLGVEGEGTVMLQNAALPKKEWLPTILLK